MFSGAGVMEKGDVIIEHVPHEFFIESKYSGEVTAKGQHSVSFQYEWLEKTVLDAKAAGRIPVVAVVFSGQQHIAYMTTGEYWEEIISQLHRLYELERELDRPS